MLLLEALAASPSLPHITPDSNGGTCSRHISTCRAGSKSRGAADHRGEHQPSRGREATRQGPRERCRPAYLMRRDNAGDAAVVRVRSCARRQVPRGVSAAACSQGRYVTVVRRNGQLYAIDSVCFHAGGPLVRSARPRSSSRNAPNTAPFATVPRALRKHYPSRACSRAREAVRGRGTEMYGYVCDCVQGLGDIEEVNGRACLVCPWHYYKVRW